MSERIRIGFEGADSGIEELTWGQRAGWHAAELSGTTESAGGMMELAPGLTVDDMATLLRYLMNRHQALRTRVVLDAGGHPQQEVVASGEIELEVVDADDDGDPAVIAEALRVVYEHARWDYLKDWPVRMAVVRQRGRATHLVAMYSDLCLDGYGIDALVADLANMDETGRPRMPLDAILPLEQARTQQTPAGLRQNRASLRRWERQLRAIAPKRFGEAAEKSSPRYQECRLRSPAMHMALRVLAERTGVHTGTIMLGAYGVALAQMSGQPESVIRMYVSNRFRPGFATSVSVLAQSALCVVDVADCTFDEAVARAWKSQLDAGMHGYYDPRDLWALIDRVSAERGVEFDLMCYYNDRRRGLALMPGGPVPTEDEVLAALPRTEFEWTRRWDSFDSTSYLTLNNVPDTLECLMHVDTHCVPPEELERACRGLEQLIVSAAFDPATTTGVKA
jgi:hypothetical protein